MSPSSSSEISRRTPIGAGRAANPFAADFHAPGAIPWLGDRGHPDDASLDALLDRVRHTPGGQITGHHGAGKSTLLAHLARRARARGWNVTECRAPRLASITPSRPGDQPSILCVDSAEQCTRAAWFLARLRARHARAPILATTHRDLGLPTLAHLAMTPTSARRILAHLAASQRLTLPDDDALAAMLSRHNQSLRHVIFELYDHYERGWPW